MLLCRTDRFLSKDIKSKIALFCNVEEEAVITAKDVASIYEVPVVFSREGVDTLILRYLHLEAKDRDLKEWDELVHRIYNPKAEVTIGIVGKYVEYEDSYKSLKEALVHGALAHNLKLNLNWIEAEGLETGGSTYEEQLRDYDGILVPGGFGSGLQVMVPCSGLPIRQFSFGQDLSEVTARAHFFVVRNQPSKKGVPFLRSTKVIRQDGSAVAEPSAPPATPKQAASFGYNNLVVGVNRWPSFGKSCRC